MDRTTETNAEETELRDMIRVQLDEEDYRLAGPGDEEGELVGYGHPAALMVEEAVYYTVAQGPDDAPQVYRVDSVTPVDSETQEVQFEFPDEDEGEGDGEDDEEGEDGEDGEDEEDGEDGAAPEVIIESDAEGEKA